MNKFDVVGNLNKIKRANGYTSSASCRSCYLSFKGSAMALPVSKGWRICIGKNLMSQRDLPS